MNYLALLLTIIVGIFFLLGMLIPSFFQNKEKLILFTTSFSLIIMLFLMLGDLIPEILGILNPQENSRYGLIILIFFILGFLLLKVLDFFIPEHKHEHKEKNDKIIEHQNHFYHIGFITSISLIIHNLLEGISIYITGLNNIRAGLLMALSVGCHNLPLGIEIFISMSFKKESRKSNKLVYFLLISSSFVGALFLFFLDKEINFYIEGILLSITLGMLFYISFCELLPEIYKNKSKKETKLGILCGLLLAFVLSRL